MTTSSSRDLLLNVNSKKIMMARTVACVWLTWIVLAWDVFNRTVKG